MPAPGAAPAACAAVIEALPDEVDPGVRRRPVSGSADSTAAWGDPPVTLLCGAEPPDRPEEEVVVNGVPWSVRDIGAGFRWTTRGFAVTVAVDVPDAYANGAEIVNPLAAAVSRLPRLPSPAPTPTP